MSIVLRGIQLKYRNWAIAIHVRDSDVSQKKDFLSGSGDRFLRNLENLNKRRPYICIIYLYYIML